MKDLIQGYKEFREHVFPKKRQLFRKLADGQKPKYLFITCCDSRVVPNEFTQTDAGFMFVERSIGNLVPYPSAGENEAVAAVEYAVKALGITRIIICGHTECGAMKAILDPDSLDGMPIVRAWLKNAEETRRVVAEKHGDKTGDALLEAAIRENVRIQVANAKRIPCVAELAKEGRLEIHGWVFDFARGEVEVLDENSDAVVLLENYRTGDDHQMNA